MYIIIHINNAFINMYNFNLMKHIVYLFINETDLCSVIRGHPHEIFSVIYEMGHTRYCNIRVLTKRNLISSTEYHYISRYDTKCFLCTQRCYIG